MRILHVIKGLGYGGASRSLCSIAGHLKELGDYHITVASLIPVSEGREMLEENGIHLLEAPAPARLSEEVQRADIVQVEWWNSPHIYAFLQSQLPPSRLLLWVHVAGDQWPHLLSDELVRFSDFVVLGCRYASRCPPVQRLSPAARNRKTAVIYSAADFGRLASLEAQPHDGFNIGYIGTVSFKKMHPGFISMSAAVNIADSRFIVCGRGDLDLLRRQAESLGVSDRFEFRGYVHDIKPILEVLDVYGYPLCDSPGAELSVQEAMYAGIPPVVFGLGGLQDVVTHDETGLVVDSESAYSRAVEQLCLRPQERMRLGRHARAHAKREFGGANSAAKLHRVYQGMLRRPKRKRAWRGPVQKVGTLSLGHGALRLIESLHPQAPFFLQSAQSQSMAEILAAEEEIANISQRQFTILKAYRNYYPDDPVLNLWYALALDRAGAHREAQSAFRRTLALADRPWRVTWHLARSLKKAGNQSDAATRLDEVLNAAPQFGPGRELRDRHRKDREITC